MRELLEFWVNISDYKNKQKDELEYYKAFNKLKKQLKKEGNLIPNPELTIPEEDVKKLKAQGKI